MSTLYSFHKITLPSLADTENLILDMSDFSDAQDRRLVQLACMYERRGSKISWVHIASKMKGKSTTKLANRLKTLQNRHGKQVLRFPVWYFVKSQIKTKRSKKLCVISTIPRDTSRMYAPPSLRWTRTAMTGLGSKILYPESFVASEPEQKENENSCNLLTRFNMILDGQVLL